MSKTPKGNRLHIALFGRTNVGKSTFLNLIVGQDISITSPVAGTTTDVVEKSMELLPIGPVLFLDTGGLDDLSILSEKRIDKAYKTFNRADIILLVLEPNVWTKYEEEILQKSIKKETPIIAIINKTDLKNVSSNFIKKVKSKITRIIQVSSVDSSRRDEYIRLLKKNILEICPNDFLRPPALIGDLLPPGGMAVLVVPIDLEAPKGRLILPQVQTIRDALDNDAIAVVVKERELPYFLTTLNRAPDIVVCDSQVVLKTCADTPKDVKCTTFSILFSRFKGDLIEQVKGAARIESLKEGDKILISEACSHHPIEDDIGRIKIPRWLKQYTGIDLSIDFYAGRDYPDNLEEYKLVIHCGGCMLNRKEMLTRIQFSKEVNVPITNYGICISLVQGVLKRALSPFPAALMTFEREIKKLATINIK